MTVDGFAYHYHHPHHHHPHHPHQSPVHQQETFLFFLFPFSFFHFLLPLLFFHLGELGQPNHVQFRVTVNCDDGHILLFFSLPSRCPGQRQNEKSFTSGKEKSQIFVQFPVCHPSHTVYTGGNVNRNKKILRARSWPILGWVVELVLFIFCFFLLSLCILFLAFS